MSTVRPVHLCKRLIPGLALPLLVGLAGPAPAQSPVDLPVRITADEASIDDRSGTSSYRGNVVIVRGDLRLSADQLTVIAPERRPLRIEALGQPARAEAPDPEGRPRIATASRIVYRFDTEMLELEGDARLTTDSGQALGDRIQYDLVDGTIEIRASPGERVEILLEPPGS